MESDLYKVIREVEDSHWWYVGRRQILRSLLRRIASEIHPVGTSPRILDVGCGTGGNLAMLTEFGTTDGVDIAPEALEFCAARGLRNVRLGSAESLPFADGVFDIVTALDVVEHLEDEIRALREFRRVLRPGGRILVFVPAFRFLWGLQDEISHHRRRYTRALLEARLSAAGLTVYWASYANITFFLPTLIGRFLLKLTRLRPRSENSLTLNALNAPLGRLLGSEAYWLSRYRFPFGVSLVCVAGRPSQPPNRASSN